jgi:SAM-dependent methyltransferase
MSKSMGLGARSCIVEVGSNDGYLLQHFRGNGVTVLGVEPAANVAKVAIQKGIPTIVNFFGKTVACELATAGNCADLLVANNVVDLVPDLNDFMQGIKVLLKPRGVVTLEFPYLMTAMQNNEFDTIYHEHVSYFSLITAERVFTAHGLTLFDVEEISVHGDSLRIYGRHADDSSKPISSRVTALREREMAAGLSKIESYCHFQERAQETKRKLLGCLIDIKSAGKSVAGYGAPAKGNTLLNYCGIRTDFLDYTVDRNPYKQGKYTPGTHIPIYGPEKIRETKPDYLLILPWNLKEEIMVQMAHIREWCGKFIVPIPEVQIV